MDRAPIVFRTTHRTPFHALDPFGHMNTSAYLEHFLDHRFAGLRQIGLDLATIAQLPIVIVVRKAQLSYLISVLGDEEFTIESHVVSFGERDCRVVCEMKKANGRLAATCELELACVSKESKKPVPWDPALVDRFYEGASCVPAA